MMSVQRVDISKKEKRRNNYIKNSVSSLNQKSKSKEKKKRGGKRKQIQPNDFYQWRACKGLTSWKRKKEGIIITKILQYPPVPNQKLKRKEKKKGGGKGSKFGKNDSCQ